MFPQAKFIHIRRHPYDVHQSAKHTLFEVQPWWRLQSTEFEEVDDRLIQQYKEMYDGFFSQRSMIPQGSLHEIAFEDLERDPLGQLEKTYQALRLQNFADVEDRLRTYIHSLSNYQKNVFPPLAPELRTRISTECRRCFEEWGYPD